MSLSRHQSDGDCHRITPQRGSGDAPDIVSPRGRACRRRRPGRPARPEPRYPRPRTPGGGASRIPRRPTSTRARLGESGQRNASPPTGPSSTSAWRMSRHWMRARSRECARMRRPRMFTDGGASSRPGGRSPGAPGGGDAPASARLHHDAEGLLGMKEGFLPRGIGLVAADDALAVAVAQRLQDLDAPPRPRRSSSPTGRRRRAGFARVRLPAPPPRRTARRRCAAGQSRYDRAGSGGSAASPSDSWKPGGPEHRRTG